MRKMEKCVDGSDTSSDLHDLDTGPGDVAKGRGLEELAMNNISRLVTVCCGWPPIFVSNTLGRCSKCKEMSLLVLEEEEEA